MLDYLHFFSPIDHFYSSKNIFLVRDAVVVCSNSACNTDLEDRWLSHLQFPNHISNKLSRIVDARTNKA